jgi:hypothetical protein
VPRQPNEAKEQDAGSQEVTKASSLFDYLITFYEFHYSNISSLNNINNLLLLGGIEKNQLSIIRIISYTNVNCLRIDNL